MAVMHQIRNDLGKPIGNYSELNGIITYRHLKGGVVGAYNKRMRKYTRYNLKLGAPVPQSNEDYGRSDVILLEQMYQRGEIR